MALRPGCGRWLPALPARNPAAPRQPGRHVASRQIRSGVFGRRARRAGKTRSLLGRVLARGFPQTAGSAGASGGADTREDR